MQGYHDGKSTTGDGPNGISRFELFQAWFENNGVIVAEAYEDTGVDPSEPWDFFYLDKTRMTWQQMMDEPIRIREARLEWYLARDAARRPDGGG